MHSGVRCDSWLQGTPGKDSTVWGAQGKAWGMGVGTIGPGDRDGVTCRVMSTYVAQCKFNLRRCLGPGAPQAPTLDLGSAVAVLKFFLITSPMLCVFILH